MIFAYATPSDAAGPQRVNGQPFVVLIDPGHTPKQPGALGARGIYEVTYNDAMSEKLGKALRAGGLQVVFTRAPGENISLAGRAEMANTRLPNLFVSVHHDSAQLKYLTQTKFNGAPAYQTVGSIAGYSIFVSKLNVRFEQSHQFAKLLGQALSKLGRPPTLHHAEPIAGENRELLDAKLGIYRFDELFVLRKTVVPAVLLEVGVIVDAADEKYVSDSVKQDAIVQAIVAAVLAFQK